MLGLLLLYSYVTLLLRHPLTLRYATFSSRYSYTTLVSYATLTPRRAAPRRPTHLLHAVEEELVLEADTVLDHGLHRGVELTVLLVQVHRLVPQEGPFARAQHLRRYNGDGITCNAFGGIMRG